MNVKISMTEDGKVKFSTGSERVRKDNLDKWLGRNQDAVLLKLEGDRDESFTCSAGHICRIEEGDADRTYNVFVGSHLIGQLPDDAIKFAEQVESSPEFLIAIVGKVDESGTYIFIAE